MFHRHWHRFSSQIPGIRYAMVYSPPLVLQSFSRFPIQSRLTVSIQLRCICTWEGKVNDKLAGKKVRCPDCGGTLQVPAAGTASPAPPVAVRAPSPPPPPAPAPSARAPLAVPPPASQAAGAGAQSPFTKPLPGAAAKPPAKPPADEATKACPFCAETIRAAAVKCRYCGESLDGSDGKKKKNSRPSKQQEEVYDTFDSEIPFEDDDYKENPFAAPIKLDWSSGWDQPKPAAAARRRISGRTGTSPLARLGARIIDGIIGIIAAAPGYGLIVFSAINASKDPTMLFAGIGLLCVGGLTLLIVNIILLCSGKTIGKKMLSLTICNWETGRPANFGISFLREIIPNIAAMVPIAGGIFVLVDIFFIFRDDRRRIVDLMCKTVVLAD